LKLFTQVPQFRTDLVGTLQAVTKKPKLKRDKKVTKDDVAHPVNNRRYERAERSHFQRIDQRLNSKVSICRTWTSTILV
jgi:hypothetical protein